MTSGAAATDLERRLLVHGEQTHCAAGKHQTRPETWSSWSRCSRAITSVDRPQRGGASSKARFASWAVSLIACPGITTGQQRRDALVSSTKEIVSLFSRTLGRRSLAMRVTRRSAIGAALGVGAIVRAARAGRPHEDLRATYAQAGRCRQGRLFCKSRSGPSRSRSPRWSSSQPAELSGPRAHGRRRRRDRRSERDAPRPHVSDLPQSGRPVLRRQGRPPARRPALGAVPPRDNYKYQGLALWVCVAAAEFAILDLLGKLAGKSIGDLLGGVKRREIAVYRASGTRGNTPEAEIEISRKSSPRAAPRRSSSAWAAG